MIRSSLTGLLAFALIVPSTPLAAQVATSDWSPRPDSHAPAGVVADRLAPAGVLNARFQVTHHSFQDLVIGREEIAPVVVLQDWDYAPLSAERQTAVAEVSYGVASWLSLMTRIPVVRSEVQLANNNSITTTSTSGLGDVEVYSLFGLHDIWPVRAHVTAGVSIPTGPADQRGVLTGGGESILPYALQSGAGTPALLPSATLVTENEYGTVGFQAGGRYYLGENDREWAPGHLFNANVFMQYRFNDWMGGSLRVEYTRQSDISGADAGLDPFVSPLHFSLASGGTRVRVPVGVNVYFAEGALRGNRLQAELLVPAHSALNGPQLRESWGASVSWGFSFGGERQVTQPTRAQAPIQRGEVARPVAETPAEEAPAPAGTPVTLCLATGESVTVYRTADGRTLVGADRIPLEEAGGAAVVFPGNYAEGEGWFVQDEPVEFEERDFLRSGGERELDCADLIRVGAFNAVPLFVSRTSEAPHEWLYVPVRPGIWQLYSAELARVRG
ncbi:MAG: hypothetical protein EA351_10670 [Gemmatimonadales bacterium]|nr:MAG: hypothetical protein EA351_10670 [Gemmatimonadales bacterium]